MSFLYFSVVTPSGARKPSSLRRFHALSVFDPPFNVLWNTLC
jgi:hypothetical protein